jgi:hypothetical protein
VSDADLLEVQRRSIEIGKAAIGPNDSTASIAMAAIARAIGSLATVLNRNGKAPVNETIDEIAKAAAESADGFDETYRSKGEA